MERVVIEPPERESVGGERLEWLADKGTAYIEHHPSSKVRVQLVAPRNAAGALPTTSAPPMVTHRPATHVRARANRLARTTPMKTRSAPLKVASPLAK